MFESYVLLNFSVSVFMAVKWIIAVIALTLTGVVQSSHFRGGIVQWRPLNAQNFDGRVRHMCINTLT